MNKLNEDKIEEFIKVGMKKGYYKIENDRIIYFNGKSYKFKDPEEKVRACIITELIDKYKYSKRRIDTEVYSNRREPKLPSDVVVFKDDNLEEPYIVIETKSYYSKEKYEEAKREGLGNATLMKTKYLIIQFDTKRVVFDLSSSPSLKSLDKSTIIDIPIAYGQIPEYRYKKADPNNDLIKVDFKELSNIFQKCHNIIWAGGKRDPAVAFDEMSKLMFAKLYDERMTKNGQHYGFQIGTNESEEVISKRINDKYINSKKTDPSIFSENILLDSEKIYSVVSELQHISLIKTDLDSKGKAFEQFLSEIFRGKLGQYFTRREIVEFAIQMVNPTEEDIILDPACGSGGFLLYSLKKVNDDIIRDYSGDIDTIKRKQYDFSHYNLFGIEINDKIARVAMMDMVIHDDGHTNIEENTALSDKFKNNNIKFKNFTLILTNPPFGDSVKEGDKDKLGYNKLKNFKICCKSNPISEQTEILFLERCYDFLKPEGRLGIVIPDGILNNPGQKYIKIRDWIKEHFIINAIVSLPEFAFKRSGSGIRTSLLFMTKKVKPSRDEDYSMFLAVAHKIGYDAVGRPQSNELPLIAKCYLKNDKNDSISCVVKKLSEMSNRLDPRHYDPDITKMLDCIISLEKSRHIKIFRLIDLLDSSIPEIQKGKSFDENIEGDENNGVPFLQIKNITEDGILFGEGIGALEDKYILKDWFNNNTQYQIKKDDILLAITGATIGKTVVVESNNLPATFCGDIARIRIDKDKCNPVYVESFLRSSLGQIQIYKWINGSTNLHLSTDAVGEIIIPIDNGFNEQTENIKQLRKKIANYKNEITKLRKNENIYFNGLINSKK